MLPAGGPIDGHIFWSGCSGARPRKSRMSAAELGTDGDGALPTPDRRTWINEIQAYDAVCFPGPR